MITMCDIFCKFTTQNYTKSIVLHLPTIELNTELL